MTKNLKRRKIQPRRYLTEEAFQAKIIGTAKAVGKEAGRPA